MSSDFKKLAVEGVQNLAPYKAGKPIDELERELGISQIVKLASNENPMGPSPKVTAAITATLSDLTRYPDANGYHLKSALAEHCDVSPEQITLGNGSNEVLEILAHTFVNDASAVCYSQYSFVVYPLVTQAIGAEAVEVPASNYGHDLPAMAKAINDHSGKPIKMVFLANPNNPTGTFFPEADLVDFLDDVSKDIVVVLDEAYYEYALDEADYPRGLALLNRYPNLVVCRTFSKAYGLAGVRVGYSVSSPEIADLANRVRQPFNCNAMAQAAAIAALADQDYLDKGVALNREGKKQLEQGFLGLNLPYLPSLTNFIAVNVGDDPKGVYEKLLQEGVIVRPIPIPGFLRVSIGTGAENDKFLHSLEKVLK